MSHFAVGIGIRDRIAAVVPGLRQVRIAASVAEIADWTPASPAVWVVWDGDRVADTAGRGHAQIVLQRWIVAVIVRSAKEADTGYGVIEAAGEILSDVLAALMGWQPSLPTGCRPLVRVQAPSPGYGAGYGYFPVAFEAAIPLLGE